MIDLYGLICGILERIETFHTSCVYILAIRDSNGKLIADYVGATKDIHGRLKRHRYYRRGEHEVFVIPLEVDYLQLEFRVHWTLTRSGTC